MAQKRITTPGSPRRPARASAGRGAAAGLGPAESYWELSTRPLHVLIFLTPLLVAFEAGSVLYLAQPGESVVKTIEAKKLLSDFFDLFGVAGLFLPALAMVTVLLCWHILRKDPWRIRASVLAIMTLESLAWTLPLLVLAALQLHAGTLLAPSLAASAPQTPPDGLDALPWQARLTIAIGAGLYEEMLFRLVAIALLHFVLSDLLRLSRLQSAVGSIVGAAVLFAFYHDVRLESGGIDSARVLFLLLAGIYLGVLYAARGLGIVVATHAAYDVLVLVILRGE